MRFYLCWIFVLIIVFCTSCTTRNEKVTRINTKIATPAKDTIIIDCQYTFNEAIAGTKAPKFIVKQLQLIDVQYYSIDGKVHQGQILTNKKMVSRLKMIFRYMMREKFPIAQAIPVVKYHWDDELSMEANNTYSFCYRNPEYSKHARGMAIDINPFYNPQRWKKGYEYKQNKPIGAHYNPDVPGTFYESHPVVLEFKKLGMRWGHNFARKYDDHHFGV